MKFKEVQELKASIFEELTASQLIKDVRMIGELPPGFREGSSNKNCGLCTFWDPGWCDQFDTEVKKDELCDEYKSHFEHHGRMSMRFKQASCIVIAYASPEYNKARSRIYAIMSKFPDAAQQARHLRSRLVRMSNSDKIEAFADALEDENFHSLAKEAREKLHSQRAKRS